MMAASPWLLLQYAECFAGGFLISYCLCSGSSNDHANGKDEVIIEKAGVSLLDDNESTAVSVILTENIAQAKFNDLKDGLGSGCMDENQEEQAKHPEKGRMTVRSSEYGENGRLKNILIDNNRLPNKLSTRLEYQNLEANF